MSIIGRFVGAEPVRTESDNASYVWLDLLSWVFLQRTHRRAYLAQIEEESVLRNTSNDDQRPGTDLSHTSSPK